ncbi:DUF6795 domain-containing protein [Marinimicrobium sp. LS-A18]|uniref:DUF6795 domain-containing protein n=1 Tax=Marinimicrobium sp. LS-A18 TaxID=1381596 RepID=UPI0012682AAB|nr:DUF6795 domain-containing protein [Marinimicrobium sp. LS-A18]
MKIVSVFVASVIFLFSVNEGLSMSIFSKGEDVEAVLFSPLQGQLTYHGEPASNADISVWIAWKDQKGETFHYKSDGDGYFSIPKQSVFIKDSPFSQLSVGQTVTVDFEGHSFLIWKAGKSSPHLFGELGGEPVGLTCELSRDDMDAHLEYALLETKCVWKDVLTIKEE